MDRDTAEVEVVMWEYEGRIVPMAIVSPDTQEFEDTLVEAVAQFLWAIRKRNQQKPTH